MKRRNFIKLAGVSALTAYSGFSYSTSGQSRETAYLPAGFKAIIRNVLSQNPGFWNTDWDGTLLIEALLKQKSTGVPEAPDYAAKWLNHHIENDNSLTDDEFYATYKGPRSRIVRGKYLPFTTYSGFFGLPFPCYELFRITEDERAKQICLDVADAILHRTSRDKHGLILHDDGTNVGKSMNLFTIPDTLYFVTKALMIASVLDDKFGRVYRDQALYQIKTAVSFYLDREKNIARTVLYPDGVGNTFWCRASGWLACALAGVLRFLPADHPERLNIQMDLKRLADGVRKYQGPSGGLRVLIDQSETPEELSGTAMCIASIKEAVNKEWIPDEYDDFLVKGWNFIKANVSDDGNITKVYTGWAIPAEENRIIMDQSDTIRGWILAVVLNSASAMG